MDYEQTLSWIYLGIIDWMQMTSDLASQLPQAVPVITELLALSSTQVKQRHRPWIEDDTKKRHDFPIETRSQLVWCSDEWIVVEGPWIVEIRGTEKGLLLYIGRREKAGEGKQALS